MPKRTLVAILIPTSGDPYLFDVPDTLDGLQQSIGGGYIETVSARVGDNPVTLIVDEDGFSKGLPRNARASAFDPYGRLLVGDALMVGPVRGENLTSLSIAAIEQFRAVVPSLVTPGDPPLCDIGVGLVEPEDATS